MSSYKSLCRLGTLFVLGLLLVLSPQQARGQTTGYPTVSGGDWGNPAIWSTSTVPNGNYDAFLVKGYSLNYSASDNYSAAGVYVGHSSVGGGGCGILTMTGGALGVTSDRLSIGESSGGTMNQSGGTVNVTGSNGVVLGYYYTQSSAPAIYTISGNSALLTPKLWIGYFTQGNSGHASATFTQSGTTSVTVSQNITIGGSNASDTDTYSYNLNGGTLNLAGVINTNSYGTRNFYFNGGLLNYTGNAAQSSFISGLSNAYVSAGGALISSGTQSITIGQALLADPNSAGGGLTVLGSGTLILTAANTFTGGATVGGGILQMGNASALGAATGPLTLTAGTLDLHGYNLTAGSLGGTGGMVLSNSAGATPTLTVNFAYGSSSSYGGTLANGLGTLALTVSGAGTLSLGGNNTYTGTTNVAGGALYLNGGNATPTIAVANGATLGGSGSAASATATVAGGGIVQGGAGGAGCLTLGNLKFSGAGTIGIGSFANYASSPAINVLGTNGLTTSGANSVAITLPGAVPLGSGTVQLIQYSGAIQGTGSSAFTLSAAGGPLGGRGTVSLSSVGNYIDLNYSNVDYPIWTGAVSGAANGTWDTNTTANWVLALAGTSTTFLPNDAVIFDDSVGTGATTVNIASGNVSPQWVTFNNLNLPYTLQGSNGITGSAVVTVKGGGTVTIATSNSYTGGTMLSAGLLNLAGSAAIGAGPLSVSGGTLNANYAQSPGAVTLGGGLLNLANSAAVGSGRLTISGGTLDNTSGAAMTLSGNNAQNWNGNFTFLGSSNLNMGTGTVGLGSNSAVTVNANTLTVGGAISGGYNLTKAGTGTLLLWGANTYSGMTTIGGGTLQLGDGTSGHDASLATSGIANNAALIYNVYSSQTAGYTISGNGSLTKAGAGTLTIGSGSALSASWDTGNTTINGGTLKFNTGSGPATYPAGTITVNNGGILTFTSGAYYQLGGWSNTATTPVVVNPGGIIQSSAGGNSIFALNNLTLAGGTLDATGGWTSGGGWAAFNLFGTLTVTANSAIVNATGTNNFLSPGGADGNQTLTISVSSGATLTENLPIENSQNYTYAITQTGTGTVVLTAANTYTGATTISGGTLQLGDGTSGHDGTLAMSSMTDNAALAYNLFGSQTPSYSINGSGALIKLGTGTLTLAQSNSYSGNTTIGAGTLQVGNGGTSGKLGSGGVTDNGTLVFARSDNYGATLANAINGGGSLTLSAGTLVLGGNNGYTGPTSVNGGAIYLNGSNATPSITVAAGATLGGSGSVTSGAATVANGGIIHGGYNGAGTLGLAGLTFSSGGTINIGALANYTGSVPLNATALNPSSTPGLVTIDANLGVLTVSAGTYGLVGYAGTIGGAGDSAFTLVVNGIGNRQNATLLDTGTQLDAVIGGVTPYWSGTQADWTTANAWTLQPGNTPGTYQAGDNDVFDNTAASGNVALNVANVAPFSIIFANSGSFAYSVSGSYGITGSATVTINGGGAVTIATSNSYTGGTNISNGVLNANAVQALGTGPLIVSGSTLNANFSQSVAAVTLGGGLLDINDGAGSSARSLTINGGTLQVGNGGAGASVSGMSNLSNNGALMFNHSDSVTFTPVISGSGSLTQSGAGTLVLTAGNTFTGATVISGGTLQLGDGTNGHDGSLGTSGVTNNGALVYNLYGSQTVGYTIGGSGSLTKTGTGMLTYSATGALSGGVTVSGGTLNLTNANYVFPNSPITIAAGGELDFVSDSIYSSGTGPLTISGVLKCVSGSWIDLGRPVILSGGTMTSTSTYTGNNGVYDFFCPSISATGATTSYITDPYGGTFGLRQFINGSGNINPPFIIGANSTLVMACPITQNGNSSNTPVIQLGSGLFELTGVSNYPGPTYIGGGTLQVAGGGQLGSGSYAASISNSGVFEYSSSASQTFSGVISGSGSLVQNGNSLLVLSNNSNSYSGGTTVSGGTLAYGVNNALPVGGAVTVGVPSGSGTLNMATFNGSVGVVTLVGGVITGQSGATLTGTSYALQNGTISANLGGTFATLAKTTTGTVVLSGSNSYGGGTSINGAPSGSGLLQLGNSAALPANGALTANGGTLDLAGFSPTVGAFSGAGGIITNSGAALVTLTVNQTSNASFGGAINESAGQIALVKTGANMLTLANANAYSGGTTVQNGTLQLGNSAALGSGNLAANGGILDLNGYSVTTPSFSGAAGTVTNNGGTPATLTVNQGTNTVFSGAINDGLSQVALCKTGGGTLTLANVNGYGGPTIVAGGVLSAGAAGALSQNSAVTINSGTLDASAAAQTIGSLNMTSGDAGLNLAVGNLLQSTGTATFNGTLNVSNFNGGTAELMSYNAFTQGAVFTTVDVNGSPISGAYQLAYLSAELEIVPSGPPVWSNLSGGSWSTNGNWNSGTAPGTAAGQQAIVGAATPSPVTISLDTVQTLGSLTFASSSESGYTLTPGVSGTGSLTMATSDGSAAQIVVTSGSHVIHAAVTLTGSLTIAPTAGSTLEIDGNMSESLSGSGSLLLNDAGTLVLSGSNGFTGGTIVQAGTLILTNNEALAGGSSLTIGDASAFSAGPSGANSVVDPQGGYPGSGLNEPLADHEYMVPAPSITPVPEPGTLVLVVAGVVAGLATWQRRRNRGN